MNEDDGSKVCIDCKFVKRLLIDAPCFKCEKGSQFRRKLQ